MPWNLVIWDSILFEMQNTWRIKIKFFQIGIICIYFIPEEEIKSYRKLGIKGLFQKKKTNRVEDMEFPEVLKKENVEIAGVN